MRKGEREKVDERERKEEKMSVYMEKETDSVLSIAHINLGPRSLS